MVGLLSLSPQAASDDHHVFGRIFPAAVNIHAREALTSPISLDHRFHEFRSLANQERSAPARHLSSRTRPQTGCRTGEPGAMHQSMVKSGSYATGRLIRAKRRLLNIFIAHWVGSMSSTPCGAPSDRSRGRRRRHGPRRLLRRARRCADQPRALYAFNLKLRHYRTSASERKTAAPRIGRQAALSPCPSF